MLPSESNTPSSQTAHLTTETPLGPAINAWKIFLEDQGRSPHTVKAFIADVRLLTKFLPPDKTIGSVTTRELNGFLDWVQNGQGRNVPCSPKTIARRITSVKALFRWLHKSAVILVDPAEKVLQKSVLSPVPEVLTRTEAELALQTANLHRKAGRPDARPYTLLQLLLQTGIKKSECLALSPNHIEMEGPEGPFIFIRYTSPANRYKERKISLTEEWLEAYHEYTAQYRPEDRLMPWSPRRLEYLLEDISKEAGLEKHISFAMCRWTCALNDWRAGMDHNKIRQKLGISKIQWREIKMKLENLDATTPRP